MFKGRTTKARQQPIRSQRHLFHAVSIQPGEGCQCSEVEALLGERHLSEDAPTLPLAGCSHPQDCRCIYQHFDDRRTARRRETDEGLPARNVEQDSRSGVGRRITDG